MTLHDGLGAGGRKNGASAARARASKATKKRSLWVNGKGNFKTRGKRASAIVRGTYWLTQETTEGTRVAVSRGLVAVRDLGRKRTILVSGGHSYTATVPTHIARRQPAFTGSVR
jgi:ferric-dicitrate binding protein FerR (iron transport regulator)